MTHEYTTPERAPLDIAFVKRLLDEAGVGPVSVHYSRVTSSTQVEARSLLDAGVQPPFACLTDEQTVGRGRLDRQWFAPSGTSVLMTIALPRPQVLTTLPLQFGVAVAEVLREAGADVRLKWPNDIVFAHGPDLRKVGGIIAEVHGDAVVVGIGINSTMDDAELPTPEATSLSLEGVSAERERIIVGVLSRLHEVPALPLDAYRRLCDTIGRDVRVQQVNGNVVEGRATGVDDDGALLVVSAGRPVRVTSGDVSRLRGSVGP